MKSRTTYYNPAGVIEVQRKRLLYLCLLNPLLAYILNRHIN
jgi:hypothetical protein